MRERYSAYGFLNPCHGQMYWVRKGMFVLPCEFYSLMLWPFFQREGHWNSSYGVLSVNMLKCLLVTGCISNSVCEKRVLMEDCSETVQMDSTSSFSQECSVLDRTLVLNLGSALELNHFLFGKAELKCHSCEDVSFFFFFFLRTEGCPAMSTTKWPLWILQSSQDVTWLQGSSQRLTRCLHG